MLSRNSSGAAIMINAPDQMSNFAKEATTQNNPINNVSR